MNNDKDLTKEQEDQILEVLYELFPSMRGKKVNYMKVVGPQPYSYEINSYGCNPDQYTKDSPTVTFHPVTKPSHYNQHGIEAIQAIEASMSPEEFKGYLKGSVMKYIWRYTYKGKAKEDLEKAQVYLGWLIERVN